MQRRWRGSRLAPASPSLPNGVDVDEFRPTAAPDAAAYVRGLHWFRTPTRSSTSPAEILPHVRARAPGRAGGVDRERDGEQRRHYADRFGIESAATSTTSGRSCGGGRHIVRSGPEADSPEILNSWRWANRSLHLDRL